MTHFRTIRATRAGEADHGFSSIELAVVVLVIGLISVLALPQALVAVKAYRLHSDTEALISQLNLARFRATSQNTPYRVQIDASAAPHKFSMQRLCGATLAAVDSSCSSAYQPRSSGTELGPQPIGLGNSFSTTNPGGTTAYPGTITGGTATIVFYFNTRGMPVDSTGNPLTSGGAVIYVTNGSNLTNAVVVSVGGRVSAYQWQPSSSSWSLR